MTLLEFIDLSKLGTFEGTVAFVGYIIVFMSLISLVLIFVNLPRLIYYDYKCLWKKCTNVQTKKKKAVENEGSRKDLTGEVNAAIGMALFLHFNQLHDEESNVVTIDKVERRYSPWSSKIYNMTNSRFRRGF